MVPIPTYMMHVAHVVEIVMILGVCASDSTYRGVVCMCVRVSVRACVSMQAHVHVEPHTQGTW